MLVDTGAQISLINKKLITNPAIINTQNKISINSIHGTEKTLGKLTTTINKGDLKIPIELHVTENTTLKEDGILGYDVLGKRAIINGPKQLLTLKSGEKAIQYPLTKVGNINTTINHTREDNINEEITAFQKIEYISQEEENKRQYNQNLERVRNITHEINDSKIRITQL